MKIFFIICTFFFIVFNANAKSRHHIFLIHGIGGDMTTFGAGKAVLENNLSKLSETHNFTVSNFLYETGANEKSTLDFAHDFDAYIHNYFDKNTMKTNDTFSIVAHSQGGVVSLNWLNLAYSNKKESFELINNHMDSFVTLGTPFWGSQITAPSMGIKKTAKLLDIDVSKLRLGNQELHDMSLGSQMYDRFAQLLTDSNFVDFLSKIRILNLVGKSKYIDLSGISINLDGDIAVPTPSAKMNFVLADEDGFKRVDIAESYVVNSPHTRLPSGHGIAEFTSDCIDRECGNKSLVYIENHFTGNSERQFEKGYSNSFMIKIEISSDEEYRYNDAVFYLKARNTDFMDVVTDTVPFHKYTYFDKVKGKYINNFFFSGDIKNDEVFNPQIRIQMLDYKTFSTHTMHVNVMRGDYAIYGIEL